MEQSGVLKIRPAEMELAQPSFQASVQSTPANIFIQKVMAQSYTKDRMSWQWRSPSSGLLCSPLIHGVFRVDIQTPFSLNKSSQVGPLLGFYDTNVVHGADTTVPTATEIVHNDFSARKGYGYRPLIGFGSGNAVQNAIESKQVSVNGASISYLNENLYLRSLEKCYVPDEQMQRSCSTCGGCPNKGDATVTSGHVLGLPDAFGFGKADNTVIPGPGVLATLFLPMGFKGSAANATTAEQASACGFRPTEGSTADSGLIARMENFYDQIVEVNDAIENDPDLINSDPYKNGWLVKILISNSDDLDDILNSADYTKLIS